MICASSMIDWAFSRVRVLSAAFMEGFVDLNMSKKRGSRHQNEIPAAGAQLICVRRFIK